MVTCVLYLNILLVAKLYFESLQAKVVEVLNLKIRSLLTLSPQLFPFNPRDHTWKKWIWEFETLEKSLERSCWGRKSLNFFSICLALSISYRIFLYRSINTAPFFRSTLFITHNFQLAMQFLSFSFRSTSIKNNTKICNTKSTTNYTKREQVTNIRTTKSPLTSYPPLSKALKHQNLIS